MGDRVVAVTFALAAAISSTRAAEQVLRLDPTATEVRFTLPATLHTVEGVVPLRAGEIRFDETTGAAAGRIVLDASRASSANRARDRKMHDAVLESARFPEIVFAPTRLKLERTSATTAQVSLAGRLWIHGAEHSLALDASVRKNGDQIAIDGELAVPYVAWGMTDPSMLLLRVAKEVRARFSTRGTLTSVQRGSGE